ncbi:hypothetical protein [Streptomyces violascens]|uniref:hypothetical protein n=1 Tax=Streptomyces violascens TaxID=67381 RepID=UPI0036C8F999
MRAAIDAQPEPLATLRALAAQFEQITRDADNDVERDNYRNDQVRFALRCTATAWRHAARLTQKTLNGPENADA